MPKLTQVFLFVSCSDVLLHNMLYLAWWQKGNHLNLFLKLPFCSKGKFFDSHPLWQLPPRDSISMQAPNIVDFAVATSIGVMFFQELEADARVRQFEEIAEACLRLLQHLGRPPYLKSIFDGCSSSFLSPGARSNQCCLGVQVVEKEKALGNISQASRGDFFRASNMSKHC